MPGTTTRRPMVHDNPHDAFRPPDSHMTRMAPGLTFPAVGRYSRTTAQSLAGAAQESSQNNEADTLAYTPHGTSDNIAASHDLAHHRIANTSRQAFAAACFTFPMRFHENIVRFRGPASPTSTRHSPARVLYQTPRHLPPPPTTPPPHVPCTRPRPTGTGWYRSFWPERGDIPPSPPSPEDCPKPRRSPSPKPRRPIALPRSPETRSCPLLWTANAAAQVPLA